MATPRVTIDQLPIQSTPEDTNELIIQDVGVTKRLTVAALRAMPSQALTDHINDTDGAHPASAVSATSSGTGVDGTNVQTQLGQLATLVNGKISQSVADGLYVNINGDTLTGPLILVTDPTGALEAATKQYVDNKVIEAGGGITQPEADARYVNIDGDTMTGALQVDQLITTGTGLVLPVGEPSAMDRACRKDYVDAQVATRLTQAQADARYLQPGAADTGYVNVIGDTMTGSLIINNPSNQNALYLRGVGPAHQLNFQTSAAAMLGYISCNDAEYMRICAQTGPIYLRTGTTDVLTIENDNVRSAKPTYVVGQLRSYAGPNGIIIAGPSSGGPQAYLGFYGDATNVDTLGTRSGYIGYPNTSHLRIQNETPGGSVILWTAVGAGLIDFYTNGVYEGRIDSAGNLFMSKSTTNLASIGPELQSSGRVYAVTQGSTTAYSFISNILSAVDNDVHVAMRRSGTTVGSIIMNGTTGVTYQTTSDGRFKHELGEITDEEALERVMAYRPIKYQWKLDHNQTASMDGTPGGKVEWGMIAQEAIEVNDVAVSAPKGEPFQVDFEAASMDYGRITPELVAAIKALVRRVEALEGAAA